MSASTVSITANPASARRRPIIIGEKMPSGTAFEFPANDAAFPQLSGGGDDRISSGGRDLADSIRGRDTVLEKSIEVARIRKSSSAATAGGASAAASPRRTRKTVSKPEKPRWRIVVVFARNLLLLSAVVGLVQFVQKMSHKSADNSLEMPFTATDLEGRIAEMEAFLKKMGQMLQLQVEVVDKKIGSEVGDLKNEFSMKISDLSGKFTNEVKRLDGRSEGLEKLVGELSSMDLVTKEELQKFYDEFKVATDNKDGGGKMDLDAVRAVARQIVEKEIERHASDGLGMVDYALASGGATVVKHSEQLGKWRGGRFFSFNRQNEVHSDANKMLKPSFGEPGACFPLKGSHGFVEIKLRTAIVPEAVTLEHVAKSVAYDRSSAPKDCRVSGWLQRHDSEVKVDPEEYFSLAEFTYDLEKSNAQTFKLADTAGSGTVDRIRLDFTSNHGSPNHTCIYRLRVHGREPKSALMISMQS